MISGLPADGEFTFSLVNDLDPDSRQVIFSQVTYQQLFTTPEFEEAPEPVALEESYVKAIPEKEYQNFQTIYRLGAIAPRYWIDYEKNNKVRLKRRRCCIGFYW
ncbi:hypothetical protein ACFSJQ_06915 [Vibrio olivae]